MNVNVNLLLGTSFPYSIPFQRKRFKNVDKFVCSFQLVTYRNVSDLRNALQVSHFQLYAVSIRKYFDSEPWKSKLLRRPTIVSRRTFLYRQTDVEQMSKRCFWDSFPIPGEKSDDRRKNDRHVAIFMFARDDNKLDSVRLQSRILLIL